jgi:DNA-binding response OmpR family regulator
VNVLVIEDDAQWACVLAAIASSEAAAHVQIAHTFREAWSQMVARPFDVVLLDLTLPDSTPERTMEDINRMKYISARSVIVVTGVETTPGFVSMVKAMGADDVISKDAGTVRRRLLDVLGATV